MAAGRHGSGSSSWDLTSQATSRKQREHSPPVTHFLRKAIPSKPTQIATNWRPSIYLPPDMRTSRSNYRTQEAGCFALTNCVRLWVSICSAALFVHWKATSVWNKAMGETTKGSLLSYLSRLEFMMTLVLLLLWDRVFCNPGWFNTYHVAKPDHELLKWHHRHV